MKMDTLDCPSTYCYYYDKYELCNCRQATRKGSAAFIQECRAYRKLIEDERVHKEELKMAYVKKECGCMGGVLSHDMSCKHNKE